MDAGRIQRRRLLAALAASACGALLALTLFGTRADAQSAATQLEDTQGGLKATIQRDQYGIPHITADDFGGIGFGYGYAIAEDNICTLAETYVTVNAERSRYFGPN